MNIWEQNRVAISRPSPQLPGLQLDLIFRDGGAVVCPSQSTKQIKSDRVVRAL